ncbi:MAG: DUF4160 domain-containing protein [Prevotellaceae bacterium]|jgi:hypothetical protein|nr:DUF4160 domain-containing protein [Prevotellaceae bacterium]
MPKIFEYFGFVFYFYSNEHEPIHVHVIHNACESIFDMIISDGTLVEIKQRAKKGVDPLSPKDAKTAERFIQAYASNIVRKWIKFFVLKQQVRSTVIKRRF